MLIKCPTCGANFPKVTAVEIEIDEQSRSYCSSRCAEEEGRDAGRVAPLSPLPPAPSRILVAVDGSGPSLRAVERAVALAKLSGGEVRMLHAIDSRILRILGIGSAAEGARRLGIQPDDFGVALEDDAQAQLDRCNRICQEAGVRHSSQVEVRPPLEAIVDAAKNADLVVLGSRGLGAVSGTLLGSLSMRVISSVEAPVLLVH